MLNSRVTSQQFNREYLRGDLREQEPMSAHTTWRVGGAADVFYVPADKDDLVNFLRSMPTDIPVFFIGLGSNLLVRDGGIRGVVVKCHKGLSSMQVTEDREIYVEAGVACAQIARFCNRNGFVGAEFFAGIPGSMGGALAMNAGAFGGETWSVVKSVTMIDRDGTVSSFQATDFEIGYRSVATSPEHWFLSAKLTLDSGDLDESKSKVSSLLKARGSSQPVQSANAGSVFKNPESDHAARLIEQSGLKGAKIGGAQISEKHANFIVNTGHATAYDIEQLIAFIKLEIKQQFDVNLQTEVRVVGEH